MKTISLILLATLMSCTQMKLTVDGNKPHDVKIIRHAKYKEIQGAGKALQNVSGATLMIEFRQTGKQDSPQDLLSFSVGGTQNKTFLSRASLRLDKDGYLTGIARSIDTEEAQNVRAKNKISAGDIHHAALVVNYSKNEMHLYLDGKPLETEGSPKFAAKNTSDTPSLSASIGAEDDGSTFFFEGELNHPMVWSRAFAAEEILPFAQR
jgi:hypothetical protein